MIKKLLTVIVVCCTMFLTACDDSGGLSAKDLARFDCKFTGKSFINEYEICVQAGVVVGRNDRSDCTYMNVLENAAKY